MKQLKWINLLLICIIYLSACKKNDLTPVKTSNLVTVTLDGQKIDLLKKGDKYYFYDDVVFDQKTIDSISSLPKLNQRTSTKPRSAIVGLTQIAFNHWTDGIIYYTIGSGFTNAQEQIINDALDHWRNNTAVKFVPRTNQNNYVTFVWGGYNGHGGVSNWIGMKGGQQTVTLFGSFDFAIVHEIGHVVGLFHEQSRADRDNFITVNWQNIGTHPDDQFQFKTYIQQNRPGIDHGTFDFSSVMLYPSSHASINGFPTMVRASDGSQFSGSTGFLSAGDIACVNSFYGGPYAKVSNESVTIVDNGFDYEIENYVYLTFYSDEALTQPANLSTSRSVVIANSSSGFVYGQGSWSSPITYHTVNLSPGQNKYLVGFGYTKGYDDPWSESRNWNESSSTWLRSGHGFVRQ